MLCAIRHPIALALATLGLLAPAASASGIEAPQVVSGSATISQSGATTLIHAANNTIIEYQRFDISPEQTVQFVQPDSSSRVLNRITGPDVTRIDGTLLSNGIVYIVNPAGVYFSQGAVVNVGGLYAGAAQISNADFLAGINQFTNATGQVINRGSIDASLVALIGRQVANYGTIHAPNGLVTLAAGDDVLVSDRERRVFVRMSGANAQPQQTTDESAITNAGSIKAQKVIWGAGDIYAMGIHQTHAGSTTADQVEVAATDSNVHLQGRIDASNSSGVGGDVTVTGRSIGVEGTIDASGHTGGGTIRIGGDRQGTGDLPRATSTAISDGALLIASAIAQGDGGTIIVWADGSTYFTGTADARGGAAGGDGGFIETSGRQYLWVSGATVLASAIAGTGGQWLLDPTDVSVSAAPTTGMVQSPPGSGNFIPTGDPATANINVNDIINALNTGTSVTITTTSAGAAPNGGRITIDDAVAKTLGGNATFTLEADENIEINFSISSTLGLLNIVLDAADAVQINAPITTNGGSVEIDAVNDVTLTAGAIGAGAGDVSINTTSGSILEAGPTGVGALITTTGDVDLTAGGAIGGAGTDAIDVHDATVIRVDAPGGFALDGNGQVLGNGSTFDLTDIDPSTIKLFSLADFIGLSMNITTDGTDTTITDLSTPGSLPFQLNTLSGDINVLANAINIILTTTTDIATLEADNGSIALANDAINVGFGTIRIIADSDESVSGSITASGAAPHISAVRAELTSGTSIGTIANPVDLANTTEVLLGANENVFVDHDGATDVSLFSLSVRPDGAFSYLFNGFVNESFSGDANAIIQDGNGNLNLNNVQTASAATSYAFTARSGDAFIDDDGAAVASPIIGMAGDGGIFSGSGDVSVAASAGSVLPELARADKNIRTSVNDSSVVTLRALNPNRAGAFEASIGGDGTGDNFIDIANARNIIVDARDHMNIRGMNQSLLIFDMTVDAAGPNVPGGGNPIYSAPMFSDGAAGSLIPSGGLTSNGVDLFINEVDSTIATDLRFTTYSGDIEVTELQSNGGPITLTTLQEIAGAGDVRILSNSIQSFGGTVTVQATAADDGADGLQAPTGATVIRNADILINVNGIDATSSGDVNLFAGDQIDETDADDTLESINITADHLTMRARGNIGDDESVGDETLPTFSHLDIDVVSLDALAAGASNNIIVKDQGADGFTLERGSASNGFVRIDSVGTMIVEDNAAFSSGSFVWLGSEADIVEQPGDDPMLPNASAGGNVRFDAEGNIGAPGNPFDVFSAGLFALVGQGAFGGTAGAAGDIHVINLRTDIGNFDVFQLQIFNGDITVQTAGDMTIDGFPFFADNRDPNFEPFDMDNPGDITFTVTGGGTILLQNADLDDPSGFDNFEDLVFNGPVQIDVNQQFPGVNFPFTTQATTALLQGQSVTFHDTLTSVVQIDVMLTGDMTVVGAADFQDQSTISGGAISFQDTVAIAGQQQVTGTSVTYASTLSSIGGSQSLFIDTTGGGTTSFLGQVGTSADPLFQINTNADGLTRIAADIFTDGRQAFFDHVELTADVTLTDTGNLLGSGVFFTSVGSDGTPRGLTVITNTDAATFPATLPEVPLIGFAGSLGVDEMGVESAGSHLLYLRLNPGSTRTSVPAVATIAIGNRSDPDLTDIDPASPIDFVAYIDRDFEMGQDEKLTVVGDATFMVNLDGSLAAMTAATLSDLNVQGLLTFDANGSDIVLLSRTPMAGEEILEPTDSNANGLLDDFQPDMGLDIWGRDGLLFANANSITVSGPGSVRFFTANTGNVSGLGAYSVLDSGPFPDVTRNNLGSAIVLDLIPFLGDPGLGTVFAAGPLPIDERIRIPLTTTQFMTLLQILTRDPQASELMARLGGNATFDDSAPGAAGSSHVVLQRVREYVVPQIIDSYRAVFYEAITDESGGKFYEPRFDQLRQTLAEGVRLYRQSTGTEPSDPKLFRSFFEQTQMHPQTLAVLDALQQFYKEMGQLGLTDREWSFALYAIGRSVTPEGLSTDLLNMAALDQGH